MPLIQVMSGKLKKEKKDMLAEKIYTCARQVMKAPSIKIFFNEYDAIYDNGIAVDTQDFEMIIEGPDLSRDQMSSMVKQMQIEVQKALDDADFKVISVYHVNDHDHISNNGMLLSKRNNKN